TSSSRPPCAPCSTAPSRCGRRTDRGHRVADRGFPHLPFFRGLERWRAVRPLAYPIRGRAADGVRRPTGGAAKVGDLARAVRPSTSTPQPAAYQRRPRAGAPIPLVLGRGLPVYPSPLLGV